MARLPNNPVIEIDINGKTHQAIEKTAVKNGNSAGIGVPVDWIGKRILAILLED